MIGVVRYWKPIVLALVIAVVCTAWRIDRLQQYAENQRGRTNLPATAEAAAASDGKTAANGWALFGKCAAEYAGMAEVADEQRNDLAEWLAFCRVVEGTNVEKP